MKIGIIGSNTYEDKRKLRELLFTIKNKFGESTEIVSRGNTNGIESYVKKYTLEMGMQYKEFNPAHTNQNLYSALSEGYYNKKYSPINFIIRDKIFSNYVDVCFCLSESETNKTVHNCLRSLIKENKKYTILS